MDRLQRETRGDRLALIREVVPWTGQTPLGDQEGSGRARSLAMAELQWFCQGQPWRRCRVRQRALRVSRPAGDKKRRCRVLVVITGSPRPMRVVQRARLCASTGTGSQALAKRYGANLVHCAGEFRTASGVQ